MKKHLFSLIACLLAFCLLLGGCQSASPAESTAGENQAGSEGPDGAAEDATSGSPEGSTGVDPDDATGASPEAEQTRQDFDRFTQDLFLDSVVSDTISLHYTLSDPEAYGITEIPITFGALSAESFQEACQDLQETRAQLAAFSYEDLTVEQQLTYDILMNYLTVELEGTDYELYQEALGPTTGIQAQLPVLLAEYTFYDAGDVETYLQLLDCLPDYFASLLEFEQRKSEAGLFFSDTTAQDVIASCENFIADPENNYLLDVFNDKVDALEGLDEAQREDFKARNAEAVENSVIPAYRLLADALTSLLGTGVNEQGLAAFPEGKEYYAYLAASDTGSSWTPEEMIQKLNDRMASDMLALALVVQADEDWEASFNSFDFGFTEPEDMLEDLQQKILSDFPELSDTRYTVNYVHESLEESMSPAFYLTPPIDTDADNKIYINRSSSTGGLYTTLAHEGYPGHLYQTVYFTRTNPCPLRHLLNFVGYTEGWATYVEQLSYGYNDSASDSAIRMQQLNSSLSLELSALADLYVNYEGYTLEELQEFLELYGFSDPAVAQEIFDYVVAEPGAYLPSVIGWLEIEELRDTAEETLGDAFVLKEFHRFLLDMGPAPFDVIESYMEDWMAEQ